MLSKALWGPPRPIEGVLELLVNRISWRQVVQCESGSQTKIDSLGSAYHLKAFELVSSTNLSGCQWTHWGCAGIGRQLHPMKARHFKNIAKTNFHSAAYFNVCEFNYHIMMLYHIKVTLELVVNCITGYSVDNLRRVWHWEFCFLVIRSEGVMVVTEGDDSKILSWATSV